MRLGVLVAAVFSVATLTAGCIGPASVVGSGNLSTFESDASGFTRIDASHDFDITVTQSSDYSVQVACDDNLEQYLVVKKSGDTLLLGLEEGRSYTNTTLRANVTMPRCDGVELSGSSSAEIAGFTSTRPFDLALSGSSDATLIGMQTGNAEMNLSGSSDVDGGIVARDVILDLSGSSRASLQGSGERLDANCSGSSDITLEAFTVHTADVNLSGASTAWLTVEDKLSVNLSGASRAVYYGDARLVDVNLSGDSTVERG